jgi:protein-tyrosine-phosphatase
MDPQKVAFVCLHGSAKSLIAAEYLNRVAIERKLPLRATTSGPEERWDECPAVSADFDIAWTFITGRVEKLISRLSAQ